MTTDLPCRIFAARPGSSGDCVGDAVGDEAANAAPRPPDYSAQWVFFPCPVLPNENGQDGRDARLEGT